MQEDPVLRKRINPPPWRCWPETDRILTTFAEAGANAWFVGGCVRDAMMEMDTQDIDICTDLHPKTVMRILAEADIKVVPTGLDHGTVTAIVNKRHFEITTLRRDVRSHGRHADVSFTSDLMEDAERRDFTFNALYLTPHNDLIDPFDGLSDLMAGQVRFIGRAADRIREDRLRVLRFFRFFARFGKDLPDQEAMAACAAARHELKQLSVERISKEVMLLLASADPAPSLQLMEETGVLSEIFGPEASLSLIEALMQIPVPSDAFVRFASLFGANLKETLSVAMHLRLSTKARDRLTRMCRQDVPVDFTPQDLATALYRQGPQAIKDQILLRWAKREDREDLAAAYDHASHWKVPVFPIKGSDLLALGAQSGPALGAALQQLEDHWIGSDFKATKADLLDRFKKHTS